MRIIACIEDADVIEKILDHLMRKLNAKFHPAAAESSATAAGLV